MTAVQRDHATGQPADWSARYRLEPITDWRDCRMIDVSARGAAIELYDLTDDEELTGRLVLEIASIARDQVGVAVSGLLQRGARLDSGRVIVSVELLGLRPDQTKLLRLLVRQRSFG
jgi:hypothetical protein